MTSDLTLEEWQAAWTDVERAVLATWKAITEALRPVYEAINAWWWSLPADVRRQFAPEYAYRPSIMRKKMRCLQRSRATTGSLGRMQWRGSNAPMIHDPYPGAYPNTGYGWRLAEQRAIQGDW